MTGLRAGNIRERIVFLASARVNDRGFASETFSTVCAVWAQIRLVGGSNETTQDRRATKLALEIDIRYRADLTDEMRIVWRGRTFEIVGPLQINPIEGRMAISALEDESLSLAVDHITVSPATAPVARGAQIQLTATCFNDEGTAIPSIVFWSTSNASLATVDVTTGVVTGVSAGFVTITATCEGVTASAVIDVLPGTVAEFIAAFNAFGGGTAGMTLQVVWLTGTQQTVGGGFSTQILNAVNPGDGNHLRPSPGNPSGAAVNGSNHLIGKGLYCPGTAPYFASLPFRDDTTTIASLAVAGVPNNLFTDRGAGFTVVTIGKIRIGSYSWRLGNGVSNTFTFGGDSLNGPNFEPLKDPNASFGSPLSLGVGSTMVIADTHIVHMSDTQYAVVGGVLDNNFARNRYGRDLLQDVGSQVAGNMYANARDFFALENNGFDPSTDTETVGYLIGAGRMNLAQTQLLHDWANVQAWGSGLYRDTRNLGYLYGDSEQEPMRQAQSDGMDHIGHIVRGFKGRPRIPNFTLSLFARAGNTPHSFQYPFKRFLEDCDFVNRAKLVSIQWEMLNGGTVAENYAWADDMRTFLGSKGKVIGYDTTYDTDVNKAFNEPGVYNELLAHGLLHYDAIVHVHDGMDYDPYNFGDGTTSSVTGPKSTWWVTRHPREPETQEYREAFFYSMAMLGLGLDLSTQSMKVDPSVVHKDFVVGDPTFTPTWTAKRYDAVTVGGKTYTFTSRNTSIATVNSSTGVITPGGSNGETGVDCWSNDGAKGTIVINVSGAPIFLHTFTAADNASVVPSADTGQATAIQNDGVWGISSNQLYRSSPGVNPHIDKAVWDAAQAGGTFSGVLATLANQMCLVWRDSDQDNFFLAMVNTGASTLAVFRQQAGVGTQIDHGITHTWVNGDILGVILSGNTHQITINGVVVDTITDAFNNTATKFGAGMIGGGAGARWDTIKIV